MIKYANGHKYIIVGEYLDDGISGTKCSQRDELQRLLDDVAAGKVDLILFTKLDRWFRSVRHYTATQEILDQYGVGWVAIWEPIYDTTTPQGRLIVNQMMSIAQFEAENTGQRIRQVFAYKAAQGEVLTGSTPPGYKIADKHLTPSEAAESVRTAFREYSRTGSLNECMRACSGLCGLPRSKPAFKRMLQNPVYIGSRHGNDHYCEPIITRALWDDVQRQLSRNVKSSQRHTYVFSGLIRCRECGCIMGGQSRVKRGKRILQYRCPKHYNVKPCRCGNAKVVTEAALEKFLIANITDMLGDAKLRYEAAAAPVRDLSVQRSALNRKISRLKDLYLDEIITKEEYARDREELEKQLLALVDPPLPADPQELIDRLPARLSDLYGTFTAQERRRFWRGIIREIRFGTDRRYLVEFLGGTK